MNHEEEFEEGSLDIRGIDKAELLQELHNNTEPLGLGKRNAIPYLSHEQAAAVIQDRLAGVVDIHKGSHPLETLEQVQLIGARPGVFDFDYLYGRPIKCDIGGPRLTAEHVALYNRDAGPGTAEKIVALLHAKAARNDRRRSDL